MTFTGIKSEIQQFLYKLDKDTVYDIKIEKHRNKRSLDANNLSWALQNEISNVLRVSKEEIHLDMLRHYGQRECVVMLANINPSYYFKYYDFHNSYVRKGSVFNIYLVYKPTHEYDSKEMSIFIDGLIQEAKNLGIETPDEREIRMIINAMERN